MEVKHKEARIWTKLKKKAIAKKKVKKEPSWQDFIPKVEEIDLSREVSPRVSSH